MKPFLFLLILILGPLSTARSGDPDWANAKLAKEAPQKLLTVELFTIGAVGGPGIISQSEIWFRAMLQRPDAVAECQKLISNASPAGQLYGLLGLRRLDQKAFVEALPKFKDAKAPVRTMVGCILTESSTGAIASGIEKGTTK